MKLRRFEVPGLAHYSYLIESEGRALVVDPKRDVDAYLEYASANELRIAAVLETHIHADYASGARELAESSGAELWLSGHDDGELYEYRFAHNQLKDGQSLKVGGVRLSAVHTPGHTPEHLSFLLYDAARDGYPVALLSGDFVFVGSVGRPDLLGEDAKLRLAGQLYDSLHQKIGSLPDGVEVHPAHGAGSLCGSGMAERAQSTLGFERALNPFLREPREQFIQHVLGTLPPFPDYYRRMKQVNSDGAAILHRIPGDRPLTADEFLKGVEDGAVVVDLRSPEAFGGAHIPDALNIGAGKMFGTWAAWMAPYDKPVLLVGDNGDPEDARRALIQVGLDHIAGHLKGGIKTWIEAGYRQAHLPQISVGDLQHALPGGAYVLDVRTDSEWASGHIEGAQHIMAGHVPREISRIPTDRTVHVICGSGYRSSVVASVLRRLGLRDVVNVVGGMTAWNRQELPVVRTRAECRAA